MITNIGMKKKERSKNTFNKVSHCENSMYNKNKACLKLQKFQKK